MSSFTAALILAVAIVSTFASSSSSSTSSSSSSSSSSSTSSSSSSDKSSRIVEATLNLHLAFKDVDGKGERAVIEINGGFPGPVLRAKLGQTFVVHVVNHIHSYGLSMHWHGVSMEESDGIYSDGTATITQANIPPRGVHTYKFTPDHAGTFWYHAHNNGLVDGAYGALIVESADDPVTTGGDIVLLLSEWAVDVGVNLDAAMSAGALTDGVLSSLENVDSVLINGKISHTVDVEHGKTYLVRVINAGFVSNFGIIGGSTAGKPAHKFSLVMADAHYVQPINNIEHVFFGALGSGQRLTFLFTADQNTGTHQYHVQSNLRLLGPTIMADGPDSAKLFFRYANPAPDHSFAEPGFLPPAGPQFLASETVFRADKTKRQFVQVPKKPDVMLTMQTGVTPTFQFIMAANTPFDLAPGLPFIAGNRRGAVYFDINEGDVVDIVIINTLLPHPYHSHMFSGWILAHGTGDFPGYEAVFPTFNLDNPVRRDTFQVEVDPPVQDILDQNGWAVYRIIANRRGPVAFHCHILSHHMTGMMAILNVGSPPDVPAPSSLFPFCGGYSPDDVDEPFFSASDLSSSSSTSSTSSDSSDSSSSSSSSSSSKLHVGVVRPQVG